MHSLTNLAMRLDPVHMLQACGITPDDWQADLIRTQAQRILLNCSRQSGKSLMAATLAIHCALYEEQAPILVLSPSQRQSQELFRKCLDLYRALGKPVDAEAETLLRLELSNGSRILALPGRSESTIRGLSGIRLLIIDEASRVPDELFYAVRPMLAVSGGRLILLSTPWGRRGFYYQAYLNQHEWYYVEVPYEQVPRISPAFIEEEKRTMHPWMFEQEYGCSFEMSETQAFRPEDVESIWSEEVETWNLS